MVITTMCHYGFHTRLMLHLNDSQDIREGIKLGHNIFWKDDVMSHELQVVAAHTTSQVAIKFSSVTVLHHKVMQCNPNHCNL